MKRAKRFAVLFAEFGFFCVAGAACFIGAVKIGEAPEGADWYFRMMYFMLAVVVVIVLAACWDMSRERK